MLLDMQVWIRCRNNSSNITDISGIYETQTAFNISLIAKKNQQTEMQVQFFIKTKKKT
jgi:hypothetical protein